MIVILAGIWWTVNQSLMSANDEVMEKQSEDTGAPLDGILEKLALAYFF